MMTREEIVEEISNLKRFPDLQLKKNYTIKILESHLEALERIKSYDDIRKREPIILAEIEKLQGQVEALLEQLDAIK